MKTHRIALYPGDGIGKAVVVEAVRVLQAVQAKLDSFQLNFTSFPWGSAYHDSCGVVAPADFLELLQPFDAIFLGAVGDPERLPDHLTLAPLVQMRQEFDQYVCMRPAKLYRGVRSPLASPGEIDLVVLRENSEGEYVRCGGRLKPGRSDEVAVQSAIHTRAGVERILRFGFELAMKRRRRLTMITKSNALVFGMLLWDEVLEQVRDDFPEVESTRQHADAAAMDFVRRPHQYDVVVASNLFGDLLTDLAGAIVGGLGLAASSNINPERRYPSMFEPVHGSAPDITGKGIANPAAAILSAAMMMEWLGHTDAARVMESAVERSILSGQVTPDLGGSCSTVTMADAVIRHIQEAAPLSVP